MTVTPVANALFQPLIISCPTCPSAGVDQGGGVIKFFGLSAGYHTIEITSGLYNNTCVFTKQQFISNINYGCTDNTTADGCGIGCNGANNYDGSGAGWQDDGSCTYTASCWACGPNGTVMNLVYTDVPDDNLANIVFGNYANQNVCENSPGAILSGAVDFYVGYQNIGWGFWVATNYSNLGLPLLDEQATCGFACMEPTAANYDPLAVNDDGSCVWIVYGDSPNYQATDSCHVIDDYADGQNLANGSQYFFPSGPNNTLGDALCECCQDAGNLTENIELADGTIFGDFNGGDCCDYQPCGCAN